MKIVNAKISEVKVNPANPRIIKDGNAYKNKSVVNQS